MLDTHSFLLQDGGLMPMLPMLALMFMIFYFLLIRPQNKERKNQEMMRSNLRKGDKILTQGGILARVHSVRDNDIIIELEGAARMKIVKDAVIRLIEAKDGGKGSADATDQATQMKTAEAGD